MCHQREQQSHRLADHWTTLTNNLYYEYSITRSCESVIVNDNSVSFGIIYARAHAYNVIILVFLVMEYILARIWIPRRSILLNPSISHLFRSPSSNLTQFTLSIDSLSSLCQYINISSRTIFLTLKQSSSSTHHLGHLILCPHCCLYLSCYLKSSTPYQSLQPIQFIPTQSSSPSFPFSFVLLLPTTTALCIVAL